MPPKGCPSPHLVLTTLEPATFQPIVVSIVAVAEQVETAENVVVQSLEARRKQLSHVLGAGMSDPILGKEVLSFKARLLGSEEEDWPRVEEID